MLLIALYSYVYDTHCIYCTYMYILFTLYQLIYHILHILFIHDYRILYVFIEHRNLLFCDIFGASSDNLQLISSLNFTFMNDIAIISGWITVLFSQHHVENPMIPGPSCSSCRWWLFTCVYTYICMYIYIYEYTIMYLHILENMYMLYNNK